MKTKKCIFMFLAVAILAQTTFGINSYAKTYNSYVSLLSVLVVSPNIDEYADGETLM